MGIHENKVLLQSKGNSHQTKEIVHRMGENPCQLYIRGGINTQNIHETQKINLSKNQQPTEKNGQMN
jgi:hypothetical protein